MLKAEIIDTSYTLFDDYQGKRDEGNKEDMFLETNDEDEEEEGENKEDKYLRK